MFTHPYIGSQLAHERHRGLLAQANQQRLVQRLREHAGAAQRAQRAVRRLPRMFRRIRPAALL
ncbi:MAG TPA: hypothetical protein VHZ03_30270 [Trebonia sp.]|jgi:hypothetical protein|nr:hypothetical protein [Trebonia sp.]